MCLMDCLGATLAGTLTRGSHIVADLATDLWPGDAATILLQGKRASAIGAGFANGWTANGIDSDDVIRFAGHAGAQVFPTALALGEAQGLSGSRLLAALVVGYEVAHRIGRCWHAAHDVYQSEGSWGSVACAAVAAHLLRLDQSHTRHALAIAEYHAPNAPMMVDIDEPAMVKHATDFGVMNGILSAELARRGFTGTSSLLDDNRYLSWVRDIGENYFMVDGLTRKRKGFACCAWTHGAMEAAKNLVDKHQIPLSTIAAIRVETFDEALRMGTKLPTSTEEAQFNMGWPIAAMLVDGEVGPTQTLESRLADPAIGALAQKVVLVESAALNHLARLFEAGDPSGRWASQVTLVTKDGNEYRSQIEDGGFHFPQPAWDEAQIEEKFRWLASLVLDQARLEAVVELLWHFEQAQQVSELTRMLVK
jgi:2-methylcitrate dehydratase PrpD